jgi:hypothetical protein
MHLTGYALYTSLLALGAQAWLPGEHRQILSRDGVDLFNRSSSHEAGLLKKRYLPGNYGNDKNAIRGVNLGGLFIVENWMADDVFKSFGCNSASEFDCVSSLNNQAKANSDFQSHWDTWIAQDDFSVSALVLQNKLKPDLLAANGLVWTQYCAHTGGILDL